MSTPNPLVRFQHSRRLNKILSGRSMQPCTVAFAGTKNFAQHDNDVMRLVHRYRLAVQLRGLAYDASARHALRYEEVNPGLVYNPLCAGSASKRKPACVMPARRGA
jgi:hypothetical protein